MSRYYVYSKPGAAIQLREKPAKKAPRHFQGQQPQVVAVFTVLGTGYTAAQTRKPALAMARKVCKLLNQG